MKPLISIITTTINVPNVLLTYVVSDEFDVHYIVAGDVNTPVEAADLVENLPNGTYLSTVDQRTVRWRSHTAIGLRSIQRRNVALLHAIALGSDVIITIDDDNFPVAPETFIEAFHTRLSLGSHQVLSCETGWYDPGRLLIPPTVARGYPITKRHMGEVRPTIKTLDEHADIHVVAGLTIGDPDIDAIERIVNRPWVDKVNRTVTFDIGTWAPFNTQNTAYTFDVAPLMQCLVGVGRYDDIIMSYIARKIMDDLGYHVYYGRPFVKQVRNEHDLVKDMQDEMFGYVTVPTIVERLRGLTTRGSVIDRLVTCYSNLSAVLPEETQRANDAWIVDVSKAYEEGMRSREQR